MEMYSTVIPVKTVLFLVLETFSLWLLLRGVKYLLGLLKNDFTQKQVPFYFPIFVNVIWLLFLLYLLSFLLYSYFIVSFLCLLLLLLLAWRAVRNWLYGIVFRLYRGNLTGVYVGVEDKVGVISNWGVFQFCVKLENGQFAYIPYEKVFSTILLHAKVKTTEYNQKQLSLTVKGNFKPEVLEKQIRKKMLSNPWVLDCKNITFSEIDEQENRQLEITYTLSEDDKNRQLKEQLTFFIRKSVIV